jgi:hypothetical protein
MVTDTKAVTLRFCPDLTGNNHDLFSVNLSYKYVLNPGAFELRKEVTVTSGLC